MRKLLDYGANTNFLDDLEIIDSDTVKLLYMVERITRSRRR
jgi:hypothetical protein